MAVHGSGFAVDVESGLQNFDDAASLRLDPLKLQPLILASGQWGERSMQLLKSDLERFQQGLSGRFNDESLIRDFGNWVRKIRIDRTEIPRSTEYAEWIDRFANSNLKKRKASENVVRKSVVRTPAIAEFVSLFSSCKKELQRARSDDSIEKGDEFTLVSTGDVFTANERLPSGENGEIFGTSIPAMLIKTAFSRSEFCLELAALTALKGLGGRIPVLYEVDDAVGRMMVMRRVGKTDWPLNNDPVRPSNEHLAQVIEIVRDLHEAGLVHGDLHEGNIRMDAEHVYLIDFGMVRPIYTRGADSLKTRRTDMMRLTEFVITTSAPGGLEMLADMDVLGDDDRPDYEKWIAHFRSSL
jgi:predicted Ser/Thr protein kinase